MGRADDVRLHFHRQAGACQGLGSPFTSRLCRLAADNIQPTGTVWERMLDWPGDPKADALALRFAGALHGLVLRELDAGLSMKLWCGDSSFDGKAVHLADVDYHGRWIHWVK